MALVSILPVFCAVSLGWGESYTLLFPRFSHMPSSWHPVPLIPPLASVTPFVVSPVLLLFLLFAPSHSLQRFECWCFLSSVLRPFLYGLIAWDKVIFQKEVGHEISRLLNLPSTNLEESRMWKSETSISDVRVSEIKTETTMTSGQKAMLALPLTTW